MGAFRLLLAVATVGQLCDARGFLKKQTLREEACHYCYRVCPVSCFVGTCGLYSGLGVHRYQLTSQCFTCDASTAAAAGGGAASTFGLCSADEAGAPLSYVKTAGTGPTGPAVPGDAGAAAKEAAEAASDAVRAAQLGAEKAEVAARAATANYANAGGGASASMSSVGQDIQVAQAHSMAMQIRADDALKVAQAAHLAWKDAADKYNQEVERLRAQQMIVDRAEEILAKAEADSEAARKAYQAAATASAQAARDAAIAGQDAANQQAAQAQAEELAYSARAAERRLIIASKAAQDAAAKVGYASSIADASAMARPTLPPCQRAALVQMEKTGKSPTNCRIEEPKPTPAAPEAAQPDLIPGMPTIPAMPHIPTAEEVLAMSSSSATKADGTPDYNRITYELSRGMAQDVESGMTGTL